MVKFEEMKVFLRRKIFEFAALHALSTCKKIDTDIFTENYDHICCMFFNMMKNPRKFLVFAIRTMRKVLRRDIGELRQW